MFTIFNGIVTVESRPFVPEFASPCILCELITLVSFNGRAIFIEKLFKGNPKYVLSIVSISEFHGIMIVQGRFFFSSTEPKPVGDGWGDRIGYAIVVVDRRSSDVNNFKRHPF